MKITVVEGDLTNQPDVDAIVNAANTDLVLGAGVAGAIRRKGGDLVDREGQAKAPIGLGEAVETSAGKLPNRYVIHAAVVSYRDEDRQIPRRAGSLTSEKIIRDATIHALKVAERLRLKSIALPAFGTGVANFPLEECAPVMIAAAREYARQHLDSGLEEVRFVLFGSDALEAFQREGQRR